jgi:hypothetical protein
MIENLKFGAIVIGCIVVIIGLFLAVMIEAASAIVR